MPLCYAAAAGRGHAGAAARKERRVGNVTRNRQPAAGGGSGAGVDCGRSVRVLSFEDSVFGGIHAVWIVALRCTIMEGFWQINN